MSAKPEPPQDEDLHALDSKGAESKRKRRAEGHVVRAVAGAMAGEVLAAVAGQAPRDEDDAER
jgi:hypothetical protein